MSPVPRRWKPGKILKANLSDGTVVLAQLLRFPFVRVFDSRGLPQDEADALGSLALGGRHVLFTVMAHKSVLSATGWKELGVVPLDGTEVAQVARMSSTNPGQVAVHDMDRKIHYVPRDKLDEYEPMAVWEPWHIERRVADFYAGRPNELLAGVRSLSPR